VLNEYLAHMAATTGDLYSALLDPEPDEALLDGAGDIIDALCAVGGPAKDIRDYADGPAVIGRYLALVGNRPPNLARVSTVLRLGRYLASENAAGRARLARPAVPGPARPGRAASARCRGPRRQAPGRRGLA